MTPPTTKPRIAVLGTGAQGASIATDFALAGLDVTFIGQWPAHVEAIRANGITINAVIEIASNMWTHNITNHQSDLDESWFALSALDPAQQHRVEEVADLLRHSGFVEVTDDIHSAKRMKLGVNAAELIPSAIVNTALNDAARALDIGAERLKAKPESAGLMIGAF